VVLLAPTGRAAKVLESYAHAGASTIHRRIYRMSSGSEGVPSLSLAPNTDEGALFIVDEASMIGTSSGGDGPFGDRDLLEDLFRHLYAAARLPAPAHWRSRAIAYPWAATGRRRSSPGC
jgi:exodeoxyribonuclease-5